MPATIEETKYSIQKEKSISTMKDQINLLQSTLTTKKSIHEKLAYELKNKINELDILNLEKLFHEMDAKKTSVIPFISTLPKAVGLTEEELLSWEQASTAQYGQGPTSYLLYARDATAKHVYGASYVGSLMRFIGGTTIAGSIVSPDYVMQKIKRVVAEQRILQEKSNQFDLLEKEIIQLEKEILSLRDQVNQIEIERKKSEDKIEEKQRKQSIFSFTPLIKENKYDKIISPVCLESKKSDAKFDLSALENITLQEKKETIEKQENEKSRMQEEKNYILFSTFFGGVLGLIVGFLLGIVLIPVTGGNSLWAGPLIGAFLGGALTYNSSRPDTTNPPASPATPSSPITTEDYTRSENPIYRQLGISPASSPKEIKEISKSPIISHVIHDEKNYQPAIDIHLRR